MAWAPYISINYQTALRRTTKKTLLMFFPVRTRNSTYSFVRKPYQWVGADWFFWTGLLQLVWVMWYSAILHTETFNKRYPFIYMYFFLNSKKGFFSSFPKALSFKSSITYVLILLDASFLHFSTCIVRMSNSAKLNLVSEKNWKGTCHNCQRKIIFVSRISSTDS